MHSLALIIDNYKVLTPKPDNNNNNSDITNKYRVWSHNGQILNLTPIKL